jgi:hypothetical protein
MKCEKIKKWISDEIDRGLAVKNQKALEIHLSDCAECRAYQEHLKKIQRETKTLAAPVLAPGYWEESITRLKEKLETVEPRGKKVPYRSAPTLFHRFRWAWAGALMALAAAAGISLLLFKAQPSPEDYPLAFEDQVIHIYEKIAGNADLEQEFNSELQASIQEHSGEPDGEVRHLLYGNSFFLESLSDEEVELLDTALKKELKI